MTTTRHLTAIALRILALTYLVTGATGAIIVLTQLMVVSASGSHWGHLGWLGSATAIAVQSVAAGILLTFAPRLAAAIVPEAQPVEIGLGNDWPRAIFRCCVRVTGVVVMVHGIPKVVAQLTHYAFFRSQSMTLQIPTDIWADGLGSVVYVALGLYLLKGGNVFLRLAEGSAEGDAG